MKKSVYSIVLMDDVVEAIDNLAYSMNTSRSNLINQILAEKVACITPEKRMKSIFNQIECLMTDNDSYQIQNHQSDAMLSIKSLIRYKYRPTVRYSVQLYRNPEDSIGNLRVSFRTQSEQLINAVTDFFILWAQIEEMYVGNHFKKGASYTIDSSRYQRKFTAVNGTETDIGTAIAEYIKVMDNSIKLYFSDKESGNIISLISNMYSEYLKGNDIII